MTTRTFFIATFVFAVSFGTPLIANAQICTKPGDSCANGTAKCVQGDEGVYCNVLNNSSAQSVNPSPGSNQNPSPGFNPKSGSTGQNVTLINPLGKDSNLNSFLESILEIVIRIGTIVVILMLVYCGFKFVIARGEPAKISEARNNLLWTVVGALILLGAVAIQKGIEATVRALTAGS